MPKLYYASPRDLPTKTPIPGMTQRIIRAVAATIAITDLAPKTVVESHKHPMEQTGVVTKGSLVMVIAGEQRILTPGDTYRVPPNASHGARVEPGDVIGSGTCGTGCILELSMVHGIDRYPWLQPGDVVELSVERLGKLRNRVVAGAALRPLR